MEDKNLERPSSGAHEPGVPAERILKAVAVILPILTTLPSCFLAAQIPPWSRNDLPGQGRSRSVRISQAEPNELLFSELDVAVAGVHRQAPATLADRRANALRIDPSAQREREVRVELS